MPLSRLFSPSLERHDPTRGLGFAGLVMLTAVTPLATDIYLPSLPQVLDDLDATASTTQLTISGFMLGMALGQMLSGTVSDAIGRRRLLIVGEVVCLIATIACALAPSISLLIVARAVQGVSGAAGVALARAIVIDVTTGARTGRLIAAMMAIMGIAPAIAPVLGSALAVFGGWRTVFWAIAVVLVLNIVIVLVRIPETLPPERRQPATVPGVLHLFLSALSRRRYVGYLLAFALAFGGFFCYIAATPFILQVHLGFTPIAFGLTFAAGSIVMTSSVTLSGKLAGRVRPERLFAFGLIGLLVAAAVFVVGLTLGMPLWAFLTGVGVLTIAMGQNMPNGTTLALEQTRDIGGTGSALLGGAQFLMASLVAPLVGVEGESNPAPFTIMMVILAVLAMIAFIVVARRGPTHAPR